MGGTVDYGSTMGGGGVLGHCRTNHYCGKSVCWEIILQKKKNQSRELAVARAL